MEEQGRTVPLNVRLTPEEARLIDEKRVRLKERLGNIPSRSEVVRMALDAFLQVEKKATRGR